MMGQNNHKQFRSSKLYRKYFAWTNYFYNNCQKLGYGSFKRNVERLIQQEVGQGNKLAL